MPKKIVVATTKPWNFQNFKKWKSPTGFEKELISSKDDLTFQNLSQINPCYVFFPHWSWKIPSDVYENFECIVFHMTDLPFGRGGSPLQNLISRGIYQTKISALRVIEKMDAGPIYLKEPFDVFTGSAQELYWRASEIVFEMMTEILISNPTPEQQSGDVVEFKRRMPTESEIPESCFGRSLYDFIRMLDVEGYPRAFITRGGKKIEFCGARLNMDGSVNATAKMFVEEKEEENG